MINAYLLYTGDDGHSHVQRGSVDTNAMIAAETVHFKETPAGSSYDWHPDPIPQYVITLSGMLLFETRTGEAFELHPGDVLIATDDTGSGHKWRLIDDQPWRRMYVIFKTGADPKFIPSR